MIRYCRLKSRKEEGTRTESGNGIVICELLYEHKKVNSYTLPDEQLF